MALVTTMSGVIGVLAAMAGLLWFSTYIESRHLGPLTVADEGERVADVVPIEGPGPLSGEQLPSVA